jgi:hypothetical protein
MFAHVEVELAEADELRRTVQGQQTAIQAAHDRTTAAEAAIREAEDEAERFKADYLSACQTIATMHEAATGRTGMGPLLGVVEDVASTRDAFLAQQARADTLDRLCREQRKRADDAEEHLAAYVDIFGPDAVDDFHKMQHRAVTAEAVTAETKRLMERRTTTLRERAEQAERRALQLEKDARDNGADAHAEHQRAKAAERALQRVRDADSLGAALAVVAEHDGLTPDAACQFAAVAEAAESPRALLDEQARAHAIELAEWKRRNANQGETIRDMGRANWEAHERVRVAEFHAADAKERARVATVAALALRAQTPDAAQAALARIRAARTWGEVWTPLGMYYGMTPEQAGTEARNRRTEAERTAEQRIEAYRGEVESADEHTVRAMAARDRYRAAWRSARRRAHAHAAEEQRVRGWLEHWADRARTAEGDLATIRNRDQLAAALLTIRDRAFRYRAAWHSARRGRAAAEAALAAELPDVIAGQQARAADEARAQLARP